MLVEGLAQRLHLSLAKESQDHATGKDRWLLKPDHLFRKHQQAANYSQSPHSFLNTSAQLPRIRNVLRKQPLGHILPRYALII
jgi:hypothetical protein